MKKETIQAGIICGIICVAFMWAYMSVFMTSMSVPASSGQKGGMHMMPDGTMMGSDVGAMGMEGMMMDMTARLKGKTGAELEKTFLEDMIVHHQGAVDMSRELLKGTNKPELIEFANTIITAQSSEIEMQRKWLKEWYSITR